jgi:hypothetical protein
MRAYLINGGTIYPLAGQAGVAESVHSSVAELRINGEIAKQTAQRVRADAAQTWDRKNLKTTVQFSTVRTFSTPADAELWSADYDETFPRSGVLGLIPSGMTSEPDSIIVAGDLTSDGTTPLVFPRLEYYGITSGRAEYNDPLDNDTAVFWTGSEWSLCITGIGPVFSSTEDVASPELVTTWTSTAPATGTPALIGDYPDHRYLLEAVLDPPDRRVIGCSVILSYTATGGRLANDLPGTWNSDIPWPVGGNWEDS